MTPAAAFWMRWPFRARIQLHSLAGILRLRRMVRGLLELGARAAAKTHFSTFCCIFQSSVVVTRYPPVSTRGQSVGVSGQTIADSAGRTCHTKWGAFQFVLGGGVSTTGSSLAAS